MPIHLVSARRKLDKLQEQYGDDAVILNVTSKGPDPWVKFSPFYPHGDIPIPFSPGRTAASVEGIWQGLKVFEGADVCESTLANTTMKNIKRTVRKYGRVLGHRRGVDGKELLPYLDARMQIYLPVYRWVLDNKLQDELSQLRDLARDQTVVLLDYETNEDLQNVRKGGRQTEYWPRCSGSWTKAVVIVIVRLVSRLDLCVCLRGNPAASQPHHDAASQTNQVMHIP